MISSHSGKLLPHDPNFLGIYLPLVPTHTHTHTQHKCSQLQVHQQQLHTAERRLSGIEVFVKSNCLYNQMKSIKLKRIKLFIR